MATPNESAADEIPLVVQAVAVELGLGLLAMLLGYFTDVDVRQWIPKLDGESFPSSIVYGMGYGVVAAVPMLALAALLERLPWAPFRDLRQLDKHPFMIELLQLSYWDLLAIAIAAGVGEELLLRGWLMGWLLGPVDVASPERWLLAIAVSSIAFGLLHFISPLYIVVCLLLGLYLAALVYVSGNLLVPIVAHAAYDAVLLFLAKRDKQSIA